MTSKASYSNFKGSLITDFIKKRQWLLLLNFIILFFAMPVSLTLQIQRLGYDTFSRQMIPETINDFFGFNNGLLQFLVILGAFGTGLAAFNYLHSRVQTDFYHCLPIRRERLFLTNFTGGILLFLLPYSLNLVFSLAVAAIYGHLPTVNWPHLVLAFLVHLLFFLCTFSITVLAGILTGHHMLHALGAGVLFFYLPALGALLIIYMETFYSTFYQGVFFEEILLRSSPILRYATLHDPLSLWEALTYALVTTAAILLALFLYRCRPSESAGTAITFPLFQAISKFCLLLAATLASGLFFHVLGDSGQSYAWLIFGALCGCLLSHGILEVIFHFDLRAAARNVKWLAAFALFFAVLLATFIFDLTGYDEYLPSTEQVAAVSVYMSPIDSHLNYNGLTYEQGVFQPRHLHSLEKTSFQDPKQIQAVLALAKQGIAVNDHSLSLNYNGERSSLVGNLLVRYTLQNGQHKYRQYTIDYFANKEDVAVIFNSKEYKAKMYDPYQLTADQLETIYVFSQYAQEEKRLYSSSWEITGDDKAALLSAYQRDLESLTIAKMEKEIPLYYLKFIPPDNYNESPPYDSYSWRIDRADAYPVYPSFYNTWQELKKAGLTSELLPTSADVDRIELYSPSGQSQEYYDQADLTMEKTVPQSVAWPEPVYSTTITSQEDIEELLSCLVPEQALRFNPFYPVENSSYFRAEVYLKSPSSHVISCVFRKGQIPPQYSK